MKDNTLILVDYDNVYVTLKNTYRDFKQPNIMYDVITKIKEHYKNDNIVSCKLFADFQKVQISDAGYEILRKNHVEIEHVFNGKNASDVILMINCMKFMMQYPHINKIILVSSDSDLVPIFHEVQLLNKKLEVLYFDVNTAEDHKRHIKEIGIANISIESLLQLQEYKICNGLEEFYEYKKSDKIYFEQLLQCINDIIKELYNKYLKTDDSGNILNVGCATVETIAHKIKENGICCEKELNKNTTMVYCNLLEMLLDKKILVKHVYSLKEKPYTTFILSEEYLNSNDININDLVKKNQFP